MKGLFRQVQTTFGSMVTGTIPVDNTGGVKDIGAEQEETGYMYPVPGSQGIMAGTGEEDVGSSIWFPQITRNSQKRSAQSTLSAGTFYHFFSFSPNENQFPESSVNNASNP